MAAGGALEPFWQMYPFHKTDAVRDLLKPYKIGRLHEDDMIKPGELPDFSELQKEEMERSPRLLKH